MEHQARSREEMVAGHEYDKLVSLAPLEELLRVSCHI